MKAGGPRLHLHRRHTFAVEAAAKYNHLLASFSLDTLTASSIFCSQALPFKLLQARYSSLPSSSCSLPYHINTILTCPLSPPDVFFAIMVYYDTTNDLVQAFSRQIGMHEATSTLFYADNDRALTLANLRHGHTVLEIGSGHGQLITKIKPIIGNGFCVAVDAVQGFVDTDIPWAIHRARLSVYPSNTPDNDIHVLCTLATDPGFRARVRGLPGAPQNGFDRIFAIHVLNTVPPGQRKEFLRRLRTMLAPDGILITNMSARFLAIAPSPEHAGVPAQFRDGYTEAPGSVVVSDLQGTVNAPIGPVPRKVVSAAVQISHNALWIESLVQAREAAEAAGFMVHNSVDLGKGDLFSLSTLPGSPPQATLNDMRRDDLMRWSEPGALQPGYKCVGRAFFNCVSREPGFAYKLDAVKQGTFVLRAQTVVENFVRDNHQAGRAIEHEQVGTLVKLSKV